MTSQDVPGEASTSQRPTPIPTTSAHHLRRMTGRNPHHPHRAATPLELLFDLAFVVAFSSAGNELAHAVSEGHIGAGIGAFAFVMFAVGWAWINFSWFASAYDTDDWLYRICTMVQMIGVVILVFGIPALYHSIDEGHHLDNEVLVAGYVVMRVALVAQWLRAAHQDPERRRTALTYVGFVSAAQVGWVILAVADTSLGVAVVASLVLFLIEFSGPYAAERRVKEGGTPWHAHHIAERYGLLTIIALGEGVLGTVTAVSAAIERSGWSGEAMLLVVAGIGLTFGAWWSYFLIPAGQVLHRRRDLSFGWGYGHLVVFAAITATGAGLHVAAYVLEGESTLGTVSAVLSIAVPVLLMLAAFFALYCYLLGRIDPFHILLFGLTIALLLVAVLAAVWGAPLGVCLVLITLAPFVVVVGYETAGHRHEAAALEKRLG
ncbi:low temperature requirement protein A [Citricoccus sp. GCM10030269]|uniref:low temperature requirement protein A n=1 Tax=Citricoccus sp. GCM10030269 TaxID=3273388 RepID=UPI00361D79BD